MENSKGMYQSFDHEKFLTFIELLLLLLLLLLFSSSSSFFFFSWRREIRCEMHPLMRCQKKLKGDEGILHEENVGNIKELCRVNNSLIIEHLVQLISDYYLHQDVMCGN